MAVVGKQTIGKLLIQARKIEQAQLDQALLKQEENDTYIGEILIGMGLLDEPERNRFLSQQLRIPVIDLGYYQIDEAVIKMIPARIVRQYKVLPLFKLNNTLNVAVADPVDPEPIIAARSASGLKAEPIIAVKHELEAAIDMHYGMSKFIGQESIGTVEDGAPEDIDESRIVELVNSIIEQSIRYRASDIHVENRENDIRVRFRLDGKLTEFQNLPSSVSNALLSRFKIMAKMDIAETRRPQDGRILFETDNQRLDLRISTYPTLHGEKCVLRLLNISEALHSLINLGFERDILKKYESMLVGGEGIILVSGPTGSGKTTTLYSTLNKLEVPEANIVTIEDPIEFDLKNINQAQVNVKSGVTFASALRAILRQDPDIIMVGEIRDDETVELAIRSALTGHLVFSTIHTNDAATGFTRLLNWGVEPFLITSTVKGILAQRLVRRLCTSCREEYPATPEEIAKMGIKVDTSIPLYRGKGCLACRNTGYRGRIAIFELLMMDDHIADLVMKNSPAHIIRAKAIQRGMITLRLDSFTKVKRGDTTITEVIETLGTTVSD